MIGRRRGRREERKGEEKPYSEERKGSNIQTEKQGMSLNIIILVVVVKIQAQD